MIPIFVTLAIMAGLFIFGLFVDPWFTLVVYTIGATVFGMAALFGLTPAIIALVVVLVAGAACVPSTTLITYFTGAVLCLVALVFAVPFAVAMGAALVAGAFVARVELRSHGY